MKTSAVGVQESVPENLDEERGIIENLIRRGIIHDPPKFLQFPVHYEAITGSRACGISDAGIQDVPSDYDVAAIAVPPPSYIYKHLTGWVPGFDAEPPGFDQWTAHHIVDPSPETPLVSVSLSEVCVAGESGHARERVFDLQVFSIVRFFELGRRGTPNILEVLFVPDSCVLRMSLVGRRIREYRELFLSCEAARKFRSCARAQIRRLEERKTLPLSQHTDAQYCYDFKAACRAVRMLDACEQMLTQHDFCLRASREQFLQVRRGEWSLRKVMSTIGQMERRIESLFRRTSLPLVSSSERLRNLLLSCLEDCYSQQLASQYFFNQPDETRRIVG
jgi:hypothetical protein